MESDLLPIMADFPTSLLDEVFHQRLVQTPPSPRCEVCAIIPVRNEVARRKSGSEGAGL